MRALFIILIFWSRVAFSQDYVPGELIVKLKERRGGGSFTTSMNKLKIEKGLALKASFSGLGLHHFKINNSSELKATLEELRQDPDVEYAEPNYYLRKADQLNQALIKMSREDMLAMSLTVTGGNGSASYQQSGAGIQANESWAISATNAENPIVAVIDTGVDITHSVFTGSSAIWTNAGEIPGNRVDDDNNGYIDDVHGWNFLNNSSSVYDDDGHGTHVAGTVLGATQDILYEPIAAAKIRIMPLKFLGADGSGTTTSAIKAIYYAVNNGAQVINNSWGGPSYSSALHEAMTYAYENGVLLVTAAGNAGKNNDSNEMYPANFDVPSNLSVAATNDWDSLASFSNFGFKKVQLAAPGVSILSTTPDETFSYSSGTSMAAPMVAGLSALIWREAPGLTGYQIQLILESSIDVKSGLQKKVKTSGRINSLKAMKAAQNVSGSEPYQPLYAAVFKADTRTPASEKSESTTGGCGTVRSMVSESGEGGSPLAWAVMVLFALPFAVYSVLRKQSVHARRKFDRFKMTNSLTIKVGDRELTGSMNSISVGGLSFNADTLLEKGGIVKMTVQSPDGQEVFEVEGQVVWCEQNKSFGVQFAERKESVTEMIQRWSASLTKI